MTCLCYMGTIAGFRRLAIPELRRAAMRGWTIPRDKRRIQNALFRARLMESGLRLGGPGGAA